MLLTLTTLTTLTTLIIFIFIVLYLIYELTIGWILCIYKELINNFLNKSKRVFNTKEVILNLSYGLVINGIFGLINSSELILFIISILLTMIGLLGIINKIK